MRILLVSVLVFVSLATARTVPFDVCQSIAVKKATASWPGARLVEVVPGYDFAGVPTAHVFVFLTGQLSFPGEDALRARLRGFRVEAANAQANYGAWVQADRKARAEGEYGTVVVSARDDMVPIPEYYNCLPRYFTSLEDAAERARRTGGKDMHFARLVYLGPGSEWFEFGGGDRHVWVDAFSHRVFDPPSTLRRPAPEAQVVPYVAKAWRANVEAPNLFAVDSGYVPEVPWTLWNYGCTPTASAMLMWYWDRRGYGRLVDYHFDRFDYVLDGKRYNLPNVQQELAQAMYTDSLYSGGTGIDAIAGGHVLVANYRHAYHFSAQTNAYGEAGQDWYWSAIKDEIDNDRPAHWAILYYYYGGNYINHSVCAVGYLVDGANNRFVTVHNTWDAGEYHWALYTTYGGVGSNSSVVTCVPGGENENNVFLNFPYDERSPLIAGLHYRIRYEATGPDVRRIELYFAHNDKRADWEFVDTLSRAETSYVWVAPDTALSGRFNLVALDSRGEELAADGSFSSFETAPLAPGQNLSLLGHLPGAVCQAVSVRDGPAYVAAGYDGLRVADFSVPELPFWTGQCAFGGYAQAVCLSPPLALLACHRDGLAIVDVSVGTAPLLLARLALAGQAKAVCTLDTFAYVACYDQGLAIIDIARPSTPVLLKMHALEGFASDLALEGSHLFVALGNEGISELDLSDPTTPLEVARYAASSAVRGMALDKDNVYAALGATGVQVFDRKDPLHKVLFGTRGQANDFQVEYKHLYVADGPQGVSVYNLTDITRPRLVGSFNTTGMTSGLALFGSQVLAADGASGLFILRRTPPTGICEEWRDSATDRAWSVAWIGQGILRVRHTLPRATRFELSVYDPTGRRVIRHGGFLPAGESECLLPLEPAAGVYFVRFTTGADADVKKLTLLR